MKVEDILKLSEMGLSSENINKLIASESSKEEKHEETKNNAKNPDINTLLMQQIIKGLDLEVNKKEEEKKENNTTDNNASTNKWEEELQKMSSEIKTLTMAVYAQNLQGTNKDDEGNKDPLDTYSAIDNFLFGKEVE